MSFSGEVKNELAKNMPAHNQCRMAELAAIFISGNLVMREKDGIKILSFTTENILIAKKVFTIIKKSFKMKIGVAVQKGFPKGREFFVLEICGTEAINGVISNLRIEYLGDGNFRYAGKPEKMKSCCRFSFARGTFLMSGRISDPRKSYHLEFGVSGAVGAGVLTQMLSDITQELKVSERKGKELLYVKEGSVIADILAAMGANVAVLNFENARILNETRGMINRRVNCEVGNLKKAAAAGQKQATDISMIIEKKGIEGIPENLRQAATLRIENPEASLQELGEMMVPPLGRSGVNHRLQKLMSIAEGLRKS